MKLVDNPEAIESITTLFKENNYVIISSSVEKKNEIVSMADGGLVADITARIVRPHSPSPQIPLWRALTGLGKYGLNSFK